ncbi:hypothetical protein [Streptomyces palmae]|nr:hypothetical protein [Streptomyces palmae]
MSYDRLYRPTRTDTVIDTAAGAAALFEEVGHGTAPQPATLGRR